MGRAKWAVQVSPVKLGSAHRLRLPTRRIMYSHRFLAPSRQFTVKADADDQTPLGSVRLGTVTCNRDNERRARWLFNSRLMNLW